MNDTASSPDPFPIVAIGASAGGLESLEQFFNAVSDESGMAYVVLQHLSPDFRSMMTELLGRCTTLPVTQAVNGERVQPGHVYLLPPGKMMTITDDQLVLTPKDSSMALHLPIDRFFESLARSRGPRCAGVVLSGTGRDGTAGAAVIEAHGGVVFAETRDSATFYGMPKSVIDAGVADAVLEPEAMPAELARTLEGAPLDEEARKDEATKKLLTQIRKRHDIDFSEYKDATINRRIERRAQAAGEDRATYVGRATVDRKELDKLTSDLLISVTRFFRDEECFDRLADEIAPRLASLPPGEDFRAWVAGCATGEEAYTVAMMLLELVDQLPEPRRIKVFATDIDRDALATAARGVYAEETLMHVPKERLERFFERRGESFHVLPRLRRCVVFSSQDILRDAPFTQVHLITCRNVLIYLRPEAQERALAYLHFGLLDGGLLMLGPSETTRSIGERFAVVDDQAHLFERLAVDSPRPALPGVRRRRQARTPAPPANHARQLAMYDALCNRFMPPSFLVDGQRRLVESFGGAERYLSIKGRRMTTDFLTLLDATASGAVAGALRALERSDQPVELHRVALGRDDEERVADLRMEPLDLDATGERRVLVTIVDEAPGRSESVSVEDLSVADAAEREVRVLELELERTREHLQTAVDDLEATNEALQAANEELMASNEELQTTNEELSSVNEELYTVNTEYQQSIAELKETNQDLAQLLATTQIGTLFLDGELRIRRFTPTLTDIIDVTDVDHGRDITTFRHRLTWPGFYAALREVVEGGAPVERATRDETGRHILVRIIPYELSDHGGIVVTMTDVSALERARRELERGEKRLQRLTNSLPVLVAYIDAERRYQFVNDAFLEMWSLDRESVVGAAISELFPDMDFSKLDQVLDGESVSFESDVPTPSGVRGLLVSYVPDWDDDHEEVRGIYVAATDITSRREIETELEAARAVADEASKAKSDFLANMSHEIRTPMTAIMGHAELLASKLVNDKNRQHVETIRRNGRHLLTVIGDLLDLSKIEQGRLELKKEPFSVASLIWDVYDLFLARAEQGGLDFRVDLPAALPDPIESDPNRVRQILFNLVSNAIKFTKEGSVVLGVRLEETVPAVLRFFVRDTGIGFPEEKVEQMFESFRQLDMSTTRPFEGSGLGLAISTQLARLLGGDLEAKGEEGVGATFTFSLEIGSIATHRRVPTGRRVLPPAPAPTSGVRLRGRVLVVDDSPDVRELIAEALRASGAEVVSLETGMAALERVRDDTERHRPFDAVIMDVHMPGLDGLETTRVLRRRGYAGPIIAVTARAMSSDRDDCIAAGCTDYLSKPVDLAALQAKLGEHLGAGPVSASRNRVVVVDDNRDAAELVGEVLEASGLDVAIETDVEAAIERWKRFGADALVTDINFDGKPEGLSLAKRIRESSPEALLIAVSGASDLEGAAKRAGFDHFLLKPFPLDELRRLIPAHRSAHPGPPTEGDADEPAGADEKGVADEAAS